MIAGNRRRGRCFNDSQQGSQKHTASVMVRRRGQGRSLPVGGQRALSPPVEAAKWVLALAIGPLFPSGDAVEKRDATPACLGASLRPNPRSAESCWSVEMVALLLINGTNQIDGSRTRMLSSTSIASDASSGSPSRVRNRWADAAAAFAICLKSDSCCGFRSSDFP